MAVVLVPGAGDLVNLLLNLIEEIYAFSGC
jgi:hypothetical protein